MKKSVLNKEKLKQILPHRNPCLMIDECGIDEKSGEITGVKNLTGKEYFFEGHFPGRPIMPGVLIIESLVQTAMAGLGRGDLKLLHIKKIKFRQTVEPGDIVFFKVKALEGPPEKHSFSCSVFIDQSLAASGEIILGKSASR